MSGAGEGGNDTDLVDLRRGGPADGAGPHGVQDRLHECLSAQRTEALGVTHPVRARRAASFAHRDTSVADPDRDAGPGSAVGGQGPFDIQGGDGCAHGCSGTFSKASRPSPRPDQRLTGQKMTSALPVMFFFEQKTAYELAT